MTGFHKFLLFLFLLAFGVFVIQFTAFNPPFFDDEPGANFRILKWNISIGE